MNNNNESTSVSTDEERPSRRIRWVGGGLVVGVIAGLVWQALQAGASNMPVQPEATVESLAHPSLVEMLANSDATRLGDRAASAVAKTFDAPPTLAGDETEICGVGRVKAGDAGQPKDMEPIRRASLNLRQKVLPVLLKSTDDAARGAGLLMQSLGDVSPGDGVDAVSVRARDELATLAAFKGSPQLYAWAMRACQQKRGEGACRMLSSDQWARIEPGNAMAWLYVAGDAQARNDAPALAEAMYQVSQASKSEARFGSLLAAVHPKLPPEADLLSRVSFGLDLIKIDARAEVPLVAASQYCAPAELRDANRHQVCAAVAEVLAKRASTLAEAALGASIGERTGWPAERVAAAADERDAVAQLSQQMPVGEDGAWSCAALARQLSQLNEMGQRGELATLRSALKRESVGPAVLARRYRESMATRVASAASAASSAGSP